MLASIQRQKRILGRIMSGKSLPQFLYRWDQRPPSVICREGFKPWNEDGTIKLIEHVTGCYSSNKIQDAKSPPKGVKHDSQWVSTGSYGMVKTIDPLFAQQILDSNLYKIDTNIAVRSGPFYDVNDHFDKAGINRPYPKQREWAKLGSISISAVIAYMTGEDFIIQYCFSSGAPNEGVLKNWKTLR
ncbi:hypothetical protein [Fluviispira vulneris]|uniref:hypothetical protein n=1 Tax=Fluviispira vulneris TaxID=2763012 RepID=UPI0016478B17|nr:hypothetical protein [Fluviispira vulneris]